MGIIATLRDRYGFTKTELSIIAVLGATYAAGSVLRWAFDQRPPTEAPAFDYSRIDSVFAARSVLKPIPNTPRGEISARIDINMADATELRKLPGIGPKLAERIVQYRKEHGPFRSVDDLRDVEGIGAKKLERLRPSAEVRRPAG